MSFLWAVSSALTWRKTALMLALGLTILQLSEFRSAAAVGLPAPDDLVVNAISAFGMLLIMLGADEMVMRGAPLQRAYALAVLSIVLFACAVSGVAQWLVGGAPGRDGLPGPWTMFLIRGLDNALWGSFAMLAYLNRRIAQRMLAAVRSAEQRREQLDRQLIDARLAATEAEVDPQMLLGSLAEIRTALRAGVPDAGHKLEVLTQTLRNALVRTRTGAAQIGQP